METRLKMRISRMFLSPFGSCRARNISDVTEKAVFPQHSRRGFHPIEPSSPKARPFPSICGPKALETSETIDSLPRKKVSEWPSSPLFCGNHEGRPCPPVSPITPLNPIYEDEFGYCEKLRHSGRNKKSKKKKTKKKKKKESRKKRKPSDMFPFNSCAQDGTIGGYWWYSNDDDDDSEGEDETETLFSSRSHSSDSSRSRRRRHRSSRKKKDGDRVGSGSLSSEMGVMPLKGRVKDTFAVVKRSSDPYNDFRTSMVEMIVEKQIFAPKDLENLLQCFLSLNAYNHHKIIVEVFTEIWEALFSDWL
ncbi:transcription repressor OFP8-like [Neltuma alba]|uniref:transcription repressor OFP8-like n=1 Tax=Neltuma alba TaxID=207710 RepID=UPI0010A41585|nr:transcription repressor OFP8-like [Prosopis alba]